MDRRLLAAVGLAVAAVLATAVLADRAGLTGIAAFLPPAAVGFLAGVAVRRRFGGALDADA